MNKLKYKTIVQEKGETPLGDYLAAATGLSKAKIKDAMNKGALWVKRRGKGFGRVRRASAKVRKGDGIEFYYDEGLLAAKPPLPLLIADESLYSVWYKPAGLLSQGTKYGDHYSLVRQAELFFTSEREVYPVHRLDREASGLMVTAHTKEAAALLSRLFAEREVEKVYRAEVAGLIEEGKDGRIDIPLDGREAVTTYEVTHSHPERNLSTLLVRIETGRKHQIRRHLEMIGHPIVGDPKYGRGNKNREGLKLKALSISFRCPFRKEKVAYTLPEDLS